MRNVWVVVVAACSGAGTPPPEPPKNQISVEDEVIVKQPASGQAEDAERARLEAIEQARAAGILGDPNGAGSGSGVAASPPANAAGPRDKVAIRNVVKAHIAQIRFCYEKELMNRPDLTGTTKVNFTIAPDGSVSQASGAGFDPVVDECVAKAIQTFRFPADPGTMQVAYPFTFKPVE